MTIESLDGQLLAARDEPRAAFADHTDGTAWDDLHLAYFLGYQLELLDEPISAGRRGIRE